MVKATKSGGGRRWFDSAHASLCLLGSYLCLTGFFRPLVEGVTIKQKALKYRPVEKVQMLFVALLMGARAVCHTGRTLRTDPALQAAFGLPGCAEPSVIADTLDAATEADVAALRAALGAIFRRHGRACRHDLAREILLLDLDLSPLPTSKNAEGAARGYLGRCRSKTGRKLARVRASQYQEIVWQGIIPANRTEALALLQEAVAAAEGLLGLDGEDEAARAKRARVEWRLDSGWGSEEMVNWLLGRGDQVTGKLKAASRVRKLVEGIAAWKPTSSAGREVAPVPRPVAFARPTTQFAVRTPSKEHVDGYYDAVLFTTRQDLGGREVVERYDGRAGMEADRKGDKHGPALAAIRKRKLAAQQVVVLLAELAHNVLVWSRRWLARRAPRLADLGIVRLVQELWAVPGRVKVVDGRLRRVRLRPEHPRAGDINANLPDLLAARSTLAI